MIDVLSLDGTWKVRWSDGTRGRPEFAQRDTTDDARYIDACVPGDVHLDALKQGWIADPYIAHNALSARWIEEMIWSYRREFDATVGALESRSWLVFDGLDLVASIFLNGSQIGSHRNSFYPCRIEVTGKLREGRNVLAVHLDSGLFDVADKPDAGYAHSLDSQLHKRHWLRKPQSQFGWDWSPRLINVGIQKSVRLEWTATSARVDQLVPMVTVSDNLISGRVKARLFVEGLIETNQTGELTVKLVETDQVIAQSVEIKPGLNSVEAVMDIENPRLWWPVGHGSQARYTVEVSLSVSGKPIGTKTARVGFRHVRFDQAAHPVSGSYFVLTINGRKIFCKGGNLVPPDMILANIDEHRYEKLVESALESNFNFLRVWGGGLYESDDFYDLCDQKGILVWQEFIYACGKYPTTDHDFHEDAKREAVFQVRRLASHPSLIAWCGNNEMESASWHWGPYRNGVRYPDYAFFHLTLRRLMAVEDPTRYYQPSSPLSPNNEDPDLHDRGDQHPWSLGFLGSMDFHKFREMICRFPNEGGFLGPTSLPTMLACLGPDQQFVQSFDWQIHDNSSDTATEPSVVDNVTLEWLGKDCRQMSIEQFTYWTGLIHGEALREYCDNFHRRMFDSAAAIFWMFNDCWPAVRSWTTVDYYLRRTPAFHPVRRSLAPVNVVIAEDGNRIVIYGINETQETVHAELRFGLFQLAGGLPVDCDAKVSLPADASGPIAQFAKSQWTQPDASGAFAILSQGSRVIARNRLFLPKFKDLKWALPELSVRVENGEAIFKSSTFVWGVCLDLDGEAKLPDNFFDVYPGIPHRLPWSGELPPNVRFVGNLCTD